MVLLSVSNSNPGVIGVINIVGNNVYFVGVPAWECFFYDYLFPLNKKKKKEKKKKKKKSKIEKLEKLN